jgi:DNA-binding transcriptional regulator YhcF (GntR family)/predicted kinase
MSTQRPRLVREEPRHQQIARNIRNNIEAGTLRDGDVLPSTRELAEQWGVSVFTIAEAMRVLSSEGLITSKSRSKRIVTAPQQTARAEVRLQRPQVLLIGGYAGSGKTELGRILARETGWPILDKDSLTRPVVEAALETLGQSPHDRESETYLRQVRPREYEALMAAATENVQCGNSAIVTAPFLREFGDLAWITRTQALYSAIDATTILVWVYCDADSMRTYMRHRDAARDAAKLADWAGYLKTIDLNARPRAPHIVIENSTSSAPLQTQAKELLKSVLEEARP